MDRLNMYKMSGSVFSKYNSQLVSAGSSMFTSPKAFKPCSNYTERSVNYGKNNL